MASENQLAALRNWLKHEIPAGHSVCEMPAEVCSDALSRLHAASEEYKEDKTKKGLVLKTKKEIVRELREQGGIDVQIDLDQKALVNPEERAWAEAQKIKEEQGRAPAPTTIPLPATHLTFGTGVFPVTATAVPEANLTQAELIAKYVELLASVTEAINADDRIPEREKGYGIKFVYYSVKDALENGKNGGSQEGV